MDEQLPDLRPSSMPLILTPHAPDTRVRQDLVPNERRTETMIYDESGYVIACISTERTPSAPVPTD